MNARKVAVPEPEVIDLIQQVNKIYACVGKKVVFFDLQKQEPRSEELFKVLCRNGKLRAPALRKEKTLIVGFDEATYMGVFG